MTAAGQGTTEAPPEGAQPNAEIQGVSLDVERDGLCNAETLIKGMAARCSYTAGHEGPHEWDALYAEAAAEAAALADTRCEQETEIQGFPVRCALEEGHEGSHAWQRIDVDDDDAETVVPRNLAEQARIAEQEKRLRRRADSYSKGVVEILGDDLSGFLACELCAPFFPGVRLPIPLTAEQTAVLRDVIGLPSLETMSQDPFSRTCEACAGKGKTLTGSAVPQYASIECLKCHGKGWLPVGDERRLDSVRPPAPAAVEGVPAPEVAQEDVDPWGRRRGDPDFGRLPGYE